MPVYEIAMLIDARGLVGETPIARTAQAMRSVQPGDVVEVIASDAGTFHAFAAWARSTGNELLDFQRVRRNLPLRHPAPVATITVSCEGRPTGHEDGEGGASVPSGIDASGRSAPSRS